MSDPTHHTVPREPRSTESKGSVILTLVVFMSAVVLVRFIMPRLVEEVHYSIELGKQRAQLEVASLELGDDPLANLSTASRLVHQKISPSVVHIETSRRPTISEIDVDTAWQSGSGEDDAVRGQGSGVIIDSEGQIITNYHVIQEAEQIRVTLSDDRVIEAVVAGVDRLTDLALLQIDGVSGLVPAEWGDSEQLQAGAMVWALGSPFGLSKTITFGIVSGKTRRGFEPGKEYEFLQSDAAVSAGNSGGPLVDSTGRIVGINTAIIGPTYQGVSFAIPSTRVQKVYDDVLCQQSPEQAWLGVRLKGLPPAADAEGALIDHVINTLMSPAATAGMRRGDVITEWDGKEVRSPADLRLLVSQSKLHEAVDVSVQRGDGIRKLKVRVGAKPLQF